jgi:protein ImuB
MAVSVALTPTARSALWLSRGTRSAQVVQPHDLPAALMRLPIELLRWPPEITQRLTRFGVSTLADLRRLPRGGLARRIGAQHLIELDAAFGRRPELRRALMELPCYHDRVVLDAEIETTGSLEPLIATRLQLLERFLIARTLALSELVLELVHRVHPLTAVRIGLALPTLSMSHLQTLIREHLSALQLPEPIVELRLRATHLVPATGCSRQLFQACREAAEALPQRQARLVEMLESRLGKQAVRALRVVADHRPEHAQAYSAIAASVVAASKNSCNLPQYVPQRPLWLLHEPVPLRPADFVIARGPESIESGWWDAHPCRREYFRAHDKHGALCWIFRDLSGQVEQWYLHGLFG